MGGTLGSNKNTTAIEDGYKDWCHYVKDDEEITWQPGREVWLGCVASQVSWFGSQEIRYGLCTACRSRHEKESITLRKHDNPTADAKILMPCFQKSLARRATNSPLQSFFGTLHITRFGPMHGAM